MGDDPTVLAYMQSLDRRFEILQTTVTTAQQIHQQDDNTKHDAMDGRMKSLENSRLAARVSIASIALGAGGGAVKMGAIAKLLAFFS